MLSNSKHSFKIYPVTHVMVMFCCNIKAAAGSLKAVFPVGSLDISNAKSSRQEKQLENLTYKRGSIIDLHLVS